MRNILSGIVLLGLAGMLFSSCASTNQTSKMKRSEMTELVKGIYKALENGSTTKAADLTFMADDFQSLPAPQTGPGKQGWAAALPFYAQLMPDLKLDIQEMVVEGNQVVVRCKTSGTPTGNFFGVPTDGTKKFEITTIDIHTIENGKVVKTHHCEDWAGAIQQVSAN